MKTLLLSSVSLCLCLGLGLGPASASAAPTTATPAAAGPTLAGRSLGVAPLASLPAAVQAVPQEIEAIARFNSRGATMAQNGFSRKLSQVREVRLTSADLSRPTPFALAGGTVTRSGRGDLVWTGEVQVADAYGFRLHLDSVALPQGSRAWTYGATGEAVALSPRLLAEGGEMWSASVFGARGWLEVEVPAAALGPGTDASFGLDGLIELVELDRRGRPVTGSALSPKSHCLVDATCAEPSYPQEIDADRRAVAIIGFVDDGYSFICSGGLLADSDTLQVSQRAFFLTARHCIGSQATAKTVDASFTYQTKTCGGKLETAHQVSGADLLASVADSDSSLLELHGLPPNPYFLPWNPGNGFVDGDVLHDISHPGGLPQQFTRLRAVSECANDAGHFSTLPVLGSVGPGSSGSVVVNAAGEAVGQLGGACAYKPIPEDICDDPEIYVFFGRFQRAYSDFAPFLEAPPPPPENEYFTDPAYPGWKFRVVISGGAQPIVGTHESMCLPETVCASGAIAGRSEVFLRVVGPKPNGKLWPTLVKFTTSQVDVWIRQLSTGVEKHYTLGGASPGVDELPGLFDRMGFDP